MNEPAIDLGSVSPVGASWGSSSCLIPHASYKQQEKNPAITESRELPDRGHSLVIDHGWREVAETTLAFIAQQVKERGRGAQKEEPILSPVIG